MFLIRILNIFVLINLIVGVPQLCLKAKPWSINGRAFVDEYKGKVLFLVFLKLDCPVCLDIIQKCDTFMRTEGVAEQFNSELNIVIVAPHSEYDSRISLTQSKYPSVKIVKESNKEPLWGWLRVGEHDGLIFDRCGKLAKHVRVPRQSAEVSRELFNTLRTILTGHSCGFCEFDAISERKMQIKTAPTPSVFAPQITAYVVPQKKTSNETPVAETKRSEDKSYFVPIKADYGAHDAAATDQGKIYAQQQQPGVFNSAEEEVFTEIKPIKGTQTINGKNDKKDDSAILKSTDALYSDSDNVVQAPSEYYDYVQEWSTPNPPQNVQIPKPTSPSGSWPTKIPQIKEKFGQPCAGYSDDICYQQQMQLSASEVHKCCRQRVLFTDQCVPGRCSNNTQQLCCIQKFLQAKLSCCLDERQSEPTSGTDKFSKCCYENFVESDDSCCTYNYAHAQWKSVHELCLPHVIVDLRNIKVKTVVPGTSVTTDFHFGQTNRWKFQCRFGAQVPQYSYFEDDGEEISPD